MRKIIIPAGRLDEHKCKPGAELYLIKPQGFDVILIPFKSRLALTEFNKKAGLHPLIYDTVKRGMKLYAHQKEETNPADNA